MKNDKNTSAREALFQWVHMVRSAAVSSVVSMTPPGNRWAKGVRNEQRAKQGIKALKTRIAKNFPLVSAYPAGKDDLYHPGDYSPAHVYILDKGKGVQPPHETRLPVLSSGAALVTWWKQNSRVMGKGQNRGKRVIVRHGDSSPQAFVTSAAVLKQAVKAIQAHAGVFLAGWKTLFDFLGRKIAPYTTPAALAVVKGKDLSKITIDKSDNLTAYNDANDAPTMQQYAQYLVDRDFPRKVDYYRVKMEPVLDKMLRKACGLNRAYTAKVTQEIHLNIAI